MEKQYKVTRGAHYKDGKKYAKDDIVNLTSEEADKFPGKLEFVADTISSEGAADPQTLTIQEIKEILDGSEVDHSDAKNKADFIDLYNEFIAE